MSRRRSRKWKTKPTNNSHLIPVPSFASAQGGKSVFELINSGIVQPSEQALTIQYLDAHSRKQAQFKAALLPTGHVKFKNKIYDSLSGFAIAAIRNVKPKRGSANGWTVVKHKGRSMEYWWKQYEHEKLKKKRRQSKRNAARQAKERKKRKLDDGSSSEDLGTSSSCASIVSSDDSELQRVPRSNYKKAQLVTAWEALSDDSRPSMSKWCRRADVLYHSFRKWTKEPTRSKILDAAASCSEDSDDEGLVLMRKEDMAALSSSDDDEKDVELDLTRQEREVVQLYNQRKVQGKPCDERWLIFRMKELLARDQPSGHGNFKDTEWLHGPQGLYTRDPSKGVVSRFSLDIPYSKERKAKLKDGHDNILCSECLEDTSEQLCICSICDEGYHKDCIYPRELLITLKSQGWKCLNCSGILKRTDFKHETMDGGKLMAIEPPTTPFTRKPLNLAEHLPYIKPPATDPKRSVFRVPEQKESSNGRLTTPQKRYLSRSGTLLKTTDPSLTFSGLQAHQQPQPLHAQQQQQPNQQPKPQQPSQSQQPNKQPKPYQQPEPYQQPNPHQQPKPHQQPQQPQPHQQPQQPLQLHQPQLPQSAQLRQPPQQRPITVADGVTWYPTPQFHVQHGLNPPLSLPPYLRPLQPDPHPHCPPPPCQPPPLLEGAYSDSDGDVPLTIDQDRMETSGTSRLYDVAASWSKEKKTYKPSSDQARHQRIISTLRGRILELEEKNVKHQRIKIKAGFNMKFPTPIEIVQKFDNLFQLRGEALKILVPGHDPLIYSSLDVDHIIKLEEGYNKLTSILVNCYEKIQRDDELFRTRLDRQMAHYRVNDRLFDVAKIQTEICSQMALNYDLDFFVENCVMLCLSFNWCRPKFVLNDMSCMDFDSEMHESITKPARSDTVSFYLWPALMRNDCSTYRIRVHRKARVFCA